MHFDSAHTLDEPLTSGFDKRLFRRMMGLISPYRLLTVATIVLAITSSGFKLVGPYLVKVAIDRHLVTGVTDGLGLIVFLYIISSALDFATRSGQLYLMQLLGQKVMFDLRMQLFSRIQRLPLTYFNRTPLGKIMTRVTNDVEALNELFTSGVITVLSDIFMLIGIVLVMLYLNARLALVTFAVLPLMFLVARYFSIKLRNGFRLARQKVAALNGMMQEDISGINVIKLFAREELIFGDFDRVNLEERDAYLSTIYYFALFMPIIELVGALAIGLILWYGGGQVIQEALTLGALVAFIEYTQKFFRPINDITEKYNVLQAAMAAGERIYQLLDEEEESRGGGLLLPQVNYLQLNKVSFSYGGERYALRDVSFDVKKGEKVALVGFTGAGKSTVINLLLGFHQPQEGQVMIDGKPLAEYDLYALRRKMGLVLQDVYLFADSVLENIRLFNPEISEDQVKEAARLVFAEEFINRLPQGYDSMVMERGGLLSQGQRQLLSFARALVYDPEILILDEATANIDSNTEALIQKALEKLWQGRTAVIVAHRLSTIRNVDRIVVLHHGKVREVGNHEELLAANGIYSKLYQIQCAGEVTSIGSGVQSEIDQV